MKRWAWLAMFLLIPRLVGADDHEKISDRLTACRDVLDELASDKDDDVPRDLMNKAVCIAVIPSAKKFAFGFGGRGGRGAVVCRTPNESEPWSPPLMISLAGGSFGLQIGGEAADLMFLFMSRKGLNSLLSSKFTLGADASIAAGPVGRTGEADTDIGMKAEILSYSRTRGVFAGFSLEGAVVKHDKSANVILYGEDPSPRPLLEGRSLSIPPEARGFLSLLTQLSPRHAPPPS